MKNILKQAGVFFLLIYFSSCAPNVKSSEVENTQQKTIGYVIGIIDGDTYDLLLEDKTTIRIRMDGIDAPEKGMPFYKVSKKFLSELCFNKNIIYDQTAQDAHSRIVAKTYLEDGRECGEELIKAGLAWHFKKYSTEKKLADLEIEARDKKIGIWSDPRPIAPWEIRKLHRQGISTKDSFDVTENNK
ncbi:MAG: thermonuclease family protein [Chitinophagales bacterium]